MRHNGGASLTQPVQTFRLGEPSFDTHYSRRVARGAHINFTSHAEIMPRGQAVLLRARWNLYVGANEIITNDVNESSTMIIN